MDDEELLARYGDVGVDHDLRAQRAGWLDHRLLIDRCGACGRWHEPPAPICPDCWSAAIEPTPVTGDGTIHMAIFLHQGPPAPGVTYTTPYPVVVVELDEQEGLRAVGTVVDADGADIQIGGRVALAWIERHGAPRPAFRLVRS